MKTTLGIVFMSLALLLGGCSGGGGSSTTGTANASVSPKSQLVGTFVDAPVAGLEFESDSGGGITDADGHFTYAHGDTVAFRIGNLRLGQAAPHDGVVTPLDLIGTADAGDARVVRILRTLQSLDANSGNGQTLEITAASRDALRTQAPVDLSNAAVTDALVLTALKGHDAAQSSVTAVSGDDYRVDAATAKMAFARYNGELTSTTTTLSYTPAATSNLSVLANASSRYRLIAWNDLGMHCVDGKDYSIFSILPPYNNLHAHLVDRTATSGKLVSGSVTLTYESVADPAGSINTSSAGKTNFWNWAQSLFGLASALPANIGLTGNPTPSATPAAMVYNAANRWWEATGIPVTPYSDAKDANGNFVKNYYPMVKVVAKDGAGTTLASTSVVLPVSDEMSCVSCHASGSGAAAKPAAGWGNDADREKDWKRNILALHDEKFPTAITTADAALRTQGKGATGYGTSLTATALAGKPVLCAACHKSNALGTGQVGTIPPLTTSMHAQHATVLNPATGVSLQTDSTRTACYLCHPGSVTKCLRGVMGNAVDPKTGKPLIDCQSCHGPMSNVGRKGREGWLDEPSCQSCHDRPAAGKPFQRFTSVFSSGTTVRTKVDARFATNADVPVKGYSLYRFSTGHGGLQCEACHGATHAEYPSSHANDNLQSQVLQGHVGTIAECTTCHASVPSTRNGGPHGLHTVGQAWIDRHGDAAKSGLAACASCHGADYRGTFLSKTTMARTFAVEGGTKTFAAGQFVGCYSCHNGPNGGD